jgi:hypothetical protein
MNRMTFRRASLGAQPGLLVGVVLAALVVGCSGDRQINPTGPSTLAAGGSGAVSAGSAGQSQQVLRHIEGTLSGRFDFTRLWGNEWWEFYSDSDCGGTVSHLGLSRLYTTHIPDLATGALTEGTFKIVAANSDEIQGTYTGVAVYDAEHPDLLAHGTATFVITGGTGRFAGATGSINATFLETFDDPSWASAGVVWTLDGSVSY